MITPTADLQDAMDAKDQRLLNQALSAFFYEQTTSIVPLLCQLIVEDWHEEHEDVALILQQTKSPMAVESLKRAAQLRFDYLLQWNNLHEFQRKCTWALADIGTSQAKEALQHLRSSTDQMLASYAEERVERWDVEASRKGVK